MYTFLKIIAWWPFIAAGIGLLVAAYFVPGIWKVVKTLLPYWPYFAIVGLLAVIFTLNTDITLASGQLKNEQVASANAIKDKDATIKLVTLGRDTAEKAAKASADSVDKLNQEKTDRVAEQQALTDANNALQSQVDDLTAAISAAPKGDQHACSASPPIAAALDGLRRLEPAAAQPAGPKRAPASRGARNRRP